MLKALLLISIISGSWNLSADDVMHSWASPLGNLRAEAIFKDADSNRTIYLFKPSKPLERHILCTFERDAQVIFSPDNSWIAVNDKAGSSESYIRLFQRAKGLEYIESKIRADIASWDLLARHHKVPYPKELIHSYARVIQWASDSSALLIELSGHNDLSAHVDNWLCVFDLKQQSVSLNLASFNRSAVVYKP